MTSESPRVVADISMSLDGFVTGPNVSLSNGMGDGGMALHAWAFSDDPDDQRIQREGAARSGAVILGRRLFDIVDGPDGWSDEVAYGAREAARPPFIVVTSTPPDSVRLAALDWTFVTTGLAAAIDTAKQRVVVGSAASDVVIMGGGRAVGTALAAGLVDVLSLHLAPIALGEGTPLFVPGTKQSLVQREVIATSTATHLVYEVER